MSTAETLMSVGVLQEALYPWPGFLKHGQSASPIGKGVLEFILEHPIEMGLEWRPVEDNPREAVSTEMSG